MTELRVVQSGLCLHPKQVPNEQREREVDQKSYAYEQVMKNAHKFNSLVKFDVNMHIYS